MYHEGEIAIQERAGDATAAAAVGRLLARTIPPQARDFLARQSMVCAALVDRDGRPWPYLLFGEPGFMSEREGREVRLLRAAGDTHPMSRSFWAAVEPGLPVGLLLIELSTRRRLRINGRVASSGGDGLVLEVETSYPNCPKYIQRRERGPSRAPASTRHFEGTILGPPQRAVLERADTCFVASVHPSAGVDASHRGGEPGFIHVIDASTFEVPDYTGNRMYNTLGNFLASGRGGLAVVDPEGARLLRLTGDVELQFDRPEDPRRPTGGTGRWWRFRVTRWLDEPLPENFPAVVADPSPFNLRARR